MSARTEQIGVDKDEWYPVFSITEPHLTYSRTLDAPAEFIERARIVFAEFEEIQRELSKLYEEARA